MKAHKRYECYTNIFCCLVPIAKWKLTVGICWWANVIGSASLDNPGNDQMRLLNIDVVIESIMKSKCAAPNHHRQHRQQQQWQQYLDLCIWQPSVSVSVSVTVSVSVSSLPAPGTGTGPLECRRFQRDLAPSFCRVSVSTELGLSWVFRSGADPYAYTFNRMHIRTMKLD